VICRNRDALFLFVGNSYRVEYAVAVKFVEVTVEQQINATRSSEFVYLLRRVGRAAKCLISMYKRDPLGDVGKVYGPIQCRVTSTGDDKFLSPEGFRVAYHIFHALPLESVNVCEFRLARIKASQPGRDDDDLAADGRS